MDTTLAGMCCVLALAVPAAFAEEQEYTLYFGLLINEETAVEAERKYLAVMGRAMAVPSVEFDIAVERTTNDCDTVIKGGGLLSSRTRHYPCGVAIEDGEYGWVAMAEGTARSTDLDALLAAAAEMHPYAYKLDVGESWESDWRLLVVGAMMATTFGLVLGKRYPFPIIRILLFVIGCMIAVAPYIIAGILNNATYVSLLDWPLTHLPAVAADTAAAPSTVDSGPDTGSMECPPVTGAGMPDGAVLCVP